MKKTMYDLLGMVKDVNVDYDYVKYYDRIKEKDDIMMAFSENIIYKLEYGNIELNDEVEILEESKGIPEKLRTWYSVEEDQSIEENCNYANNNFETTYDKINEIIEYLEYLKSKGDFND